jgi:hypothetical protein
MKARALITGVAALFLVIGAAHAQYENYGDEYDCGPAYDTVWVRRQKTGSDTSTVTIKVESRDYRNRNKTPYPTVRYNVQKDILTLNGKRCREKK